MLSQKIAYLLKKLDVENSVIAGYAGCSPANFCRLKSGSRRYSESSTTVRKFTEGIYNYCCDNGRLDDLCRLLGTGSIEKNAMISSLINWLFDERVLPDDDSSEDSLKLFGRKLTALMDLVNISNSKLSRALSVDASYISRMKNGERIPRKSTGMMMRLCTVLAERMTEQNKLEQVSGLLGVRADEAHLAELIYIWLYDHGMPANVQAVKSFIEQMNIPRSQGSLPPVSFNVPPVLIQERYSGNAGLQQAVIRFLSSVSENRSREILLYSDHRMDWLSGDFKELWAAMMLSCLRNGTRIKIIHNVERGVNEMIQAIISWMPLYLTGLIEPYYSTRPAGDRFTCTIFLDPENACVQSFSVRDMADEAEYRYITDRESLGKCRRSYDALLSRCRPLVKIAPPLTPAEDVRTVTIGKIQLCLEDNSVTVNKLDAPTASFTFNYSPMCRAFRSFAETVRSNSADEQI
ncbi:helix-turn-helix transcriptional regulator [Ruminococcus sp.]|uniref:helix-turn-helix domain-containing protein n=1 Tax=Ruminococcus sp. TaxID=41978 RepID=UPI0025E70DF4|nr:helix-turn-helix transcriptional regulator [Ruminococcus sp.]MBQ8967217.1 helix-turn-helix transcriptional regulator [Ruminococcus sp.]